MSFSHKNEKGQSNVLTDNYVPAYLPTYGLGLETFIPTDFHMNDIEVVKGGYDSINDDIKEVISTIDHHSSGDECDPYIDGYVNHWYAGLEAEEANAENQAIRICAARKMRLEAIERLVDPLVERIDRLKAEIQPLESLRAQFQIHVGHFTLSLGMIITILAMIVDACVNFSYLQSLLMANGALLVITVACLSVMSDGSMWALGTFLSHKKEKFTSKALFRTVCIGLASMFILSVVASFMIRWGSMDSTFATRDADGNVVAKLTFSLAEYGVTLVTAFVTSATGLLSFAFSLDENAYLVSVREKKKEELATCLTKRDDLLNERTLLENAPDPYEWIKRKDLAARHQIEAIRHGAKVQSRKDMAVHVNEASFTEKMAKSAKKLEEEYSKTDISLSTNITLNKAS